LHHWCFFKAVFGKNPSRALLATQCKMSHFKGSESDTQKTQENDTCCGAWRVQTEHILAKKGSFCTFEQS